MLETGCKDCGLIIKIENIDKRKEYACPRCHTVFSRSGESFELVLVMVVTSFLFFIPAFFLPIMTLEILGQFRSVTLLEALLYFVNDGYMIIAVISAGTGVIIPLVLLSIIFMMIVSLKLGLKAYDIRHLYRLYKHLTSWAMAEVYLISIFVAIVKLSGMAALTLDFGLYSFFFFLMSFYICITWFNSEDIWDYS